MVRAPDQTPVQDARSPEVEVRTEQRRWRPGDVARRADGSRWLVISIEKPNPRVGDSVSPGSGLKGTHAVTRFRIAALDFAQCFC